MKKAIEGVNVKDCGGSRQKVNKVCGLVGSTLLTSESIRGLTRVASWLVILVHFFLAQHRVSLGVVVRCYSMPSKMII